MYDLTYRKAQNCDSARDLLAAADDGKLLAGGMTLIPTLKQRLAAPDLLVDLGGIDDLAAISMRDDKLRIGAMATHAAVAESELVHAHLPGVAALAGQIGDPHVRNRGTIGGSVANNDPAACYPAALLATDATIHTDQQTFAAEDFFIGMFETALDINEIITAIEFPADQICAYVKCPNPASRYALAGVCVARRHDGQIKVAVTGAGQDGVFRAGDIETALGKNFTPDALDDVTIDPDLLLSDMHANAEFRAHLVVQMAKQAVAKLQD
ncbi:MAG: FAD binding domain-containing protein [Candidatus Puniceispirillum sp.]